MQEQLNDQQPRARCATLRRLLGPSPARLGLLMVVLGLLLWAKLLVVTGYPRTAIADPDSIEPPTPTDSPRR
ncbi:MAG: hypothetical protein H7Y88_04645 [Phycisphaerales bacterium]|nr:hypothetical protein [Phycisphaerales bacterium]